MRQAYKKPREAGAGELARMMAEIEARRVKAEAKMRRRGILGRAFDYDKAPKPSEAELSAQAALERHRLFNRRRPAHDRVTVKLKAIRRIIRGGAGRFIREDGTLYVSTGRAVIDNE